MNRDFIVKADEVHLRNSCNTYKEIGSSFGLKTVTSYLWASLLALIEFTNAEATNLNSVSVL
jgi:hypothetical protein